MYYRKILLVILANFLCSVATVAQITVVDKELVPIEGVQLFHSDKVLGVSNSKGEIKVDTSSINNDTWLLIHGTYHSTQITSKKLKLNNTFILREKSSEFNTFVVRYRGRTGLNNDITSKVDIISKKDVSFFQPSTSADLLNLQNTVYIQKSQLGGGSPMIRGFATNRILLVVDDVRMNTAIFRSGNVQNVLSIDPFSVESTEVIFGAASQFYGSDAIGGVLSFQTKSPEFSTTDSIIFEGEVDLRLGTACKEKTWHADFSLGKKKWASLTSISFSSFRDLKMGNNGPTEYTRPNYVTRKENRDTIVENPNKNIQVSTGYNQINALQKFKLLLSNNVTLVYGLHISTTSNTPRYDRLIVRNSNDSLVNGDWFYGPQNWMMNNLSLNFNNTNRLYDSSKLTIAHQRFSESRNDRKLNSNFLRQRNEKVSAFSTNWDASKLLKKRYTLSYGGEYIYNKIGSTASSLDIATGGTHKIATRYPDGSTWTSLGGYAHLKSQWTSHLTSELGARYNWVTTSGTFDTTSYPFPFVGFSNTNQALTGSASTNYSFKHGSIGVLASTAFRSPNIDDISKVFDSNNGFVIVPNASLKPECAYNTEFSFSYLFAKKLRFETSLFYTYLDNAIAVSNTTFNGVDSIVYDGTLSQVQHLDNQDFASLYGTQLSVRYVISENLVFKSNFSILQNASDNHPIRHITPNFGGSSLQFTKNKWRVNVASTYNTRFDSDKFAVNELNDSYLYTLDTDGKPFSPAWAIFNVRGSYQYNRNLSFNLGIENILNKRYRPYSSGLTAAGRNIILSFRGRL